MCIFCCLVGRTSNQFQRGTCYASSDFAFTRRKVVLHILVSAANDCGAPIPIHSGSTPAMYLITYTCFHTPCPRLGSASLLGSTVSRVNCSSSRCLFYILHYIQFNVQKALQSHLTTKYCTACAQWLYSMK